MSLLEDIVSFVYEGLDEKELIEKMNDPSEVHVNKPLKVKKPQQTKAMKQYKRKKREIDIGLANNAFGAAAGLAGTKLAWDQAKTLDPKTMTTKPAPTVSRMGRTLKKLKVNPKVAVAAAGTTIVGSQLLNGAMDAQSAQYFARERAKLKKPDNQYIKKSCDEIIEKRRNGEITTEEAIQAVDEIVSKSYGEETPEASGVRMDSVRTANINPAKYEFDGEIKKADSDKQQVFGWCSLSKVDGVDVVDRQGDYIPLEEIEKSAYHYVVNSRKGGDMHQRIGDEPLHTSDLIESFVVTPEKLEAMGLDSDAVPHGWWVGFKVNDENQWENVKKGDRVHFSVHGKGRREPHVGF